MKVKIIDYGHEFKNFIAAIKELRTLTGMGLKEAKDAVEGGFVFELPANANLAELRKFCTLQVEESDINESLKRLAIKEIEAGDFAKAIKILTSLL